MNAKTTSERVEKLRQEREALGLKRREAMHMADDVPRMAMLSELQEMGIHRTPDGAPYSASAIKAAMVGM